MGEASGSDKPYFALTKALSSNSSLESHAAPTSTNMCPKIFPNLILAGKLTST